jgi:hypothetical protein
VLAGISDENAALDFDLACTVRLNAYHMERDENRAKLIAYEVSKLFGDAEESNDGYPPPVVC